MRTRLALSAVLLAAIASSATAQTQVVVTPSSPQGWTIYQAGGATGAWDTAFPRSGNGSASFNMPDALTGYVDHYVNLLPQSIAALSRLEYDWYRSSSSTTSGLLMPSLALYMSGGDYLVYERAYNASGNAPTDTWVTENILGGNFWRSTSTPTTGTCATYGMFTTLAQFNAQCYGGNAQFIGFDLFMGNSIAGSFIAAADNITYAIGTDPGVRYNFEADAVVATPEPASLALMVTGLFALVPVARRRRR